MTKRLPDELPENLEKLTEKLVEKAKALGERLTENKIAILRLMVEDPYISKTSIAELVGISYTAVGSNIKECVANISAVLVQTKAVSGKS